MHRLFRTTTLRLQTYLDGRWGFALDPESKGEKKRWFAVFPSDADKQWVPSVWNSTYGYFDYEGPAWYHKTFHVGDCTALVINFGAVLHQAKVWLDGELLGEHFGGFLPFSFVVREPAPGEHTLVVRVDNTLSSSTIPGPHLDWYRYGGLPRPVWVEEISGQTCIRRFNLLPRLEGDRGAITVRASLLNVGDEPLRDTMRLEIDGKESYAQSVTLTPNEEQEVVFDVRIPEPKVWQPEEPSLYTARLVVDHDDQIERFGLRSIEVRGDQILLNGRSVKLLGVSRHEDHPDWGSALPEHLMRRDLDIIEELGCNTIRGGHYPNDPRFLDMCDERGLLFFEEIPLWQFSEEQMRKPIIRERARNMLLEMIERDMNHPCIWAWSLMCESATDTHGGRELVKSLVQTAKEIDFTRPVTYVSDKYADICFDLIDVISINSYTDWYLDDLDAMPWPDIFDRIREKSGARIKPLIVTEFGAGAVRGYRPLEKGVRWSEEYQGELLNERIAMILERKDVAGFYIWHLFDFRTDQRDAERVLRRPRGYNNKGLLDEYRRPKLSFWTVQQLLKTFRNLPGKKG